MNTPIQPAAPVNTVITIQPVTTTPAYQDAQAQQNPLATLANGTTVEGFVVNRDAQNNPILRTAIGDLKVLSDVFLKTGSEVIIKVDATQASLARILTVDGMSPQDYNAQATRGLTQDTITASALRPLLTPQAAAPAQPGLPQGAPILQAIILQPQAQPASLLTAALANAQSGPVSVLAQLQQLRAGTPLRLALLDLKLPPVPVSLNSLPSSNKLDSFMPPAPKPPAGELQQTIRQTEGQPASSYKPVTALAASPQPATPGQAREVAAPGLFEMPDELHPLKAQLQTAPELLRAKLEKDAPENQLIKSAVTEPNQKTAATNPPIVAARTALQTEPTAPRVNTSEPNAPQLRPAIQQPIAQPAAANQIVANVIGHDADGANILHTPFASLKIYTAQPLPTGTTLLVQADLPEPQAAGVTQAATAQASPAVPMVQSIAMKLTAELSAFSDALAWLQANHPELARQVQLRLPTVSNRLASSMLAYIVGIRTGDVNEIFGKRATRMLELSVPEILTRLKGTIGQMQTNMIDSPLQHWSIVPLPMLFGQELHQVQFYLSKEPPEEKHQPNTEGRGQRFVLELDLSHLGPMQFDGFVKDRQPTKTFDLMVRTANGLPDEVTQGIRAIFQTSMEVTGMQGQVIFQHGRQHFVKPLAEAPATRFDDGANTILA